jgi:hypothetical protein
MRHKRRRNKNVNAYRAAAGLLIFLILVSCMVYYAKKSQDPARGHRSVMDVKSLPQRVNQDLGQPVILGITVEKGATIQWWQPSGNSDVLGYNLYRYKSAGDKGEKVNASIILDTIYFDDDGSLFNSYSVAAVDSKGVQGPVSQVIAAVPEPVTISDLTPLKPSEVMKDVTFTNASSTPTSSDSLLDCTAPGMSYHGTWYLEHYPEVTGTSLMVTPYAGDYLSYSFQGTEVTVISVKHWNYGIMDVYVDGELKGSADLYSDQMQVKSAVFTVKGLEAGAHTLKLVCSGYKNPLANFTFIAVDALKVVNASSDVACLNGVRSLLLNFLP